MGLGSILWCVKKLGGWEVISELEKVFKDEKEIWERDFRDDVDIDRDQSRKFSQRFRGSIRISKGLFFTKEEYENWRKENSEPKLP